MPIALASSLSLLLLFFISSDISLSSTSFKPNSFRLNYQVHVQNIVSRLRNLLQAKNSDKTLETLRQLEQGLGFRLLKVLFSFLRFIVEVFKPLPKVWLL